MNGILTILLVTSPLNINQMIQQMRNYRSEQNRQPIKEMLNKILRDYRDGSNDTAEQKELLQLQSDED
jgi:hypothetical protein